MGSVKAQMTGFIGVNGRAVHIEEDEEFDTDHEYVTARPDVFGAPGPVRAVETAGPIEDVDPLTAVDLVEADPPERGDDTADADGVTTQTAAPIVRRGRKPKGA